MTKRGVQKGSPAAALIGILTLLFIFYILFLPPAEREALLAGDNVTPAGTPLPESILLDVPVGRLNFIPRDQFNHPLPNMFLAETSNAVILAEENPFRITKGVFGEERKTIVFSIPNLANTNNVLLSFQTPERRGTLTILLNGAVIFTGDVNTQNPPPLKLPQALLQSSNTLEFYVTGSFFRTKEYNFIDIKIIGDVTDVNKQVATTTFSISRAEIDNFESSYLNFYPICEQASVGTLSIELNGRVVSKSVPACESLNRQDLYAEDFAEGKNTLTLRIDKGTYRIEQVYIRNMVKPVQAFVDYFDISSSLYNDILDGKALIVLSVEFVDDGATKRAETNINGKLDVIDQRDPRYERDISSVIREGNNYIEIRPLAQLDISKLEVRVE